MIHITTPQQLQDINNNLTEDYILDNNLDMTGFVFTPIGLSSSFVGTFDGQGFTISNLSIDGTAGAFWGVGLFADLEGDVQDLNINNLDIIFSSTGFQLCGGLAASASPSGASLSITNVVITNLSITDDGGGGYFSNCGGLIGFLDDHCILSGCSTSGEIVLEGSRFSYIGGLIGFSQCDSTPITSFTSCHSSVSISLTGDGSNNVGGIGGFVGEDDGQIFNYDTCYALGNITLDNFTDYSGVGGFVGEILIGGGATALVYNCYSKGDIVCSNGAGGSNGSFGIGGFIGQAQQTTINKCYTTGDVEFSGGTDNGTGGFLGAVIGGQITNCYARGNVLSDASANGNGTGGFVGQHNGDSIKNCYSIGSVEGIGFVGGFMGDNSNESTSIINCYSVGLVTSSGNSDGGFIGHINNPHITIDNCSWWTGSNAHAIGSFALPWDFTVDYSSLSNYVRHTSNVNPLHDAVYQATGVTSNVNKNPLTNPFYWTYIDDVFVGGLSSNNYGSNEPDKTTFYHKEHMVYAQ